MVPLPGSPAIDAVTAGNEIPGLLSDQRGFPSNLDGDGSGVAAPDIGAVELYRLEVTTTADESNFPSGAQTSLREAIRDGADLVGFDPGLNGATIALTTALGGEIVPEKDVTIDASSLPGGVTIDGGAGTNRIFTVSSGRRLTLLGLRLTGGNGGGTEQNGVGGAIVNFGTLALTRCTLSGNGAENGGAILSVGGTLALTQCTLSGNSADYGGALYQLLTTGALTLTHCTFSGNSALDGGAIYKENGALTLTHCTFSGNHANGGAGFDGGGAIANFGGVLTLANSIVAGNTSGSFGPDLRNIATITPTGVNFIGDPADSGLTASATLLTTVANGPILLTPLGNNGGPTQTMVPRRGSPAIDVATVIGGLTTDQRGFPRNSDGNGGGGAQPDIGAVEVQTATVTTAADELDTQTGAQTSLREALRDGADIILFSPALPSHIIVLGSPLAAAKYVIIDASTPASGIIVSGNDLGRVFEVAPGVSAEFIRLIIANGLASYGGGVSVEGALTLTECTLVGNDAFAGAGAFVANNGTASLTLNRSTVSDNEASFGGGIQNEGTLVAHGSTFALNTATQEGGAISAPFNKPVTLTHCTISQNTAATGGGVIGTNVALTNSILSGNTAPSGPDWSGGVPFGPNLFGGNALLAPLGLYGGPTQTMALKPGSPARDGAAVLSPAITGDQRRFPIVGPPDLGAYEAGTFTNYNAWIWESLPTAGDGTTTDPLHAQTYDYDGDSVNNLNEWLALTDPGDPASYLRFTQLVRVGNDLQFTFPSVLGRNYTFERSTDLVSWTPLSGVFPGPGGPFTLTTTNFFTGNRSFFRIRVGP
jgi:predicted outer membrane repeat protein